MYFRVVSKNFLNFEIPCTWKLLKNNGKIWHFLHQKRDIRHHLDIRMWRFHEDVCNSKHIWGYLGSIFCVPYQCNLALTGSQRLEQVQKCARQKLQEYLFLD